MWLWCYKPAAEVQDKETLYRKRSSQAKAFVEAAPLTQPLQRKHHQEPDQTVFQREDWGLESYTGFGPAEASFYQFGQEEKGIKREL